MSSELTIRRGEAGDVPAVSDLLRQTWHDTYDSIVGCDEVREISRRWHDPEVLSRQLADDDCGFLVALDGGRVVGHAFVRPKDDATMELSRLYVLPGEQGRGIGQALLNAIRERHPAGQMVLEVQEENAGAIAFYRRNGFIETGRSAHCGADSDVPSILMACSFD